MIILIFCCFVGFQCIRVVKCYFFNKKSIVMKIFLHKFEINPVSFTKPQKVFRLLLIAVLMFFSCNASYAKFTVAADCVTGISVNPTTITPICVGSSAVTLTATITTASGTGAANITYEWFSNTSNSTTGGISVQSTSITTATSTSSVMPSTATAGTLWYYCTVTNTDATCSGSFTTTPVEVVVTSLPVLSTTQTNVLCFGNSTGTIDITVSGGTGAYTYDWSDVAGTSNSEDRTNLPVGIYSVIVTDANSCSVSSLPITITQPTSLSLTSAAVTSPIL